MVAPLRSFTGDELQAMRNREFLITKQRVIQKVVMMFGDAQQAMADSIQRKGYTFPDQAFTKGGKISKGENYKGLPYVVLDFPRMFGKESVFSYRLMFWWGHYYLSTLHLEGRALDQYKRNVAAKASRLPSSAMWLKTFGSPWEHDLNDPNWEATGELNPDEIRKKILNTRLLRIGISRKLMADVNLVDDFRTDFERVMEVIRE